MTTHSEVGRRKTEQLLQGVGLQLWVPIATVSNTAVLRPSHAEKRANLEPREALPDAELAGIG